MGFMYVLTRAAPETSGGNSRLSMERTAARAEWYSWADSRVEADVHYSRCIGVITREPDRGPSVALRPTHQVQHRQE